MSENIAGKSPTVDKVTDFIRKQLKTPTATSGPPPSPYFPLIPAAFPFCTDMILSTFNWKSPKPEDDDIKKMFDDYFELLNQGKQFALGKFPHDEKWRAQLTTLNKSYTSAIAGNAALAALESLIKLFDWPSAACLPRYSFSLKGNRKVGAPHFIERLFIADLVWLYYIDKLGILKVVGSILDEYESKGQHPFKGDDDVQLVLESMVRSRKMGLASSPEDRESTYLRCLGWPQNSPLASKPNSAFGKALFDFMRVALSFLNERRAAAVFSSAALKISPRDVRNAMLVLWQTFSPFEQGRCYNNTLSGIVSAVGGFGILHYLRTTLGIPDVYERLEQYFSEAYDKLVLRTSGDTKSKNDFLNYKDCAQHGRSLLLDIQVLGDPTAKADDIDIANWLNDVNVEGDIQAFEAAHRNLTGISFNPTPVKGNP